mgnify:CR=1 FL=1
MTAEPRVLLGIQSIDTTVEDAMGEVRRRFGEQGPHRPVRWRGPMTVGHLLARIAPPNDLSAGLQASLHDALDGLPGEMRVIVGSADEP